jgi:hypothetical protein
MESKHNRYSCNSIDSGIQLERSRSSGEGTLRSAGSTSSDWAPRKLVLLQGFKAATRDEMDVSRGDVVSVIHQTEECDWVLVEKESGEQGYVPASFCVPLVVWQNDLEDSESEDEELDRSRDDVLISPYHGSRLDRQTPGRRYRYKSNGHNSSCGANVTYASVDITYTCELAVNVANQITAFVKKPEGVAVALYSFRPRSEDDVPVTRGEWLFLLNSQDPDWIWVQKQDGSEGFVPKGYVSLVGSCTNVKGRKVNRQYSDATTPMIVEWSFDRVHPSTVSIERGEIVYADILSKTSNGWLWVHVPSSGENGFIPATFVARLE